jgi:transposase
MPTSPDTLLRRLQQAALAPAATPRALGVDDWAFRKGHTYGTILVDLERSRVIDLLPGRDGAAVQQWLRDHPGVRVISRDRASAYAQAAAEAAPDAVQVADRWHLLKNAREMLERFLQRQRPAVETALAPPVQALACATASPKQTAEGSAAVPAGLREPAPPPGSASAPPAKTPSPRELAHQVKWDKRRERFEEVRRRHELGQPIRQIARELELSRNAVRGYLRLGRCPDWRPGQARRTGLDRFRGWVDQQIQAGRDNAAELHRELQGQGYQGSYDAVRRFVVRRLAAVGEARQRANAAKCPGPAVPSSRALAFDVLRLPEKQKAEGQARVDRLRDISAEFKEVLRLSEAFAALVRQESAQTLKGWLEEAERSAVPEIKGFAEGIRQDEAAVAAATTQEWSNGPVEGQVNRLKTIKRQMYGRAGLALLRARVLHAG